MQLLYQLYYKQFGIRRLQNLLTPRLVTISSLPRDCMVHYLTDDHEHPDIDTSALWLQQYKKRIMVDYPEVLTGDKGNPRRRATMMKVLFRPFHIANKRFRYTKDAYKVIPDQYTLIVNNYNYLNQVYRYIVMPMTNYNRWWNVEKTRWDTIAKIVKESCTRNHFIFVDIPKELPSFSFLRIYSSRVNITMTRIFDTNEKLFLLEFWKWLGLEHRAESILGKLEPHEFNKVNLVFKIPDGRAVLINLGYLNSWIKGNENTTDFSTVNQFPALQVQKMFLKMLINLQSLSPDEAFATDEADSIEPTTDSVTKPADEADIEEAKELQEETLDYNEDHPLDDEQDVLDAHEHEDEISNSSPDSDIKTKLGAAETSKTIFDVIDDDSLNKKLADIDEELSILETINNKKLKDKGIHIDEEGNEVVQPVVEVKQIPIEDIQNQVYGYTDAETSLKQHLDDFSDYGLLSATDYKKFNKDIANYMAMKDPYGSDKPAVQAMVIHPDEIKIDKTKSTIESSPAVLDKTMNQSSLQSFDYDYITKVMHKDVLAMTNTLQKAGVVIKSHEIEEDHSSLGTYENHTIVMKPIDGMPSTIHIRVPKIKEDGTFIANGNKCIMRKQRVDLPIRKIAPNIVALTSYYGKTFVSLSPKKANNSVEWIIKQVNKASVNEKAYISSVSPAMVFDNNFVAPYIYNALAANFKSIKAGKYYLVFDHTEREKLIDPALLAKLEVQGQIVVGITDVSEPIIVNNNNNFGVYSKDTITLVGNIYDILQLPEQEAPVDFSEVRIFSKTVPICVILGYFIGISKLIRLLGAKYKFVEGRQRFTLEKDEYSIRFMDGTYIFSRKDRVASMILSGFLEYDNEIKQYNLTEFDRKDVYLNLLQSKGLGSLYIREMELTQQLFVDPITKSILEEMHEPVTFNGLLIKATEMLQTYHHPDSQDMASMRIRGYERIPGAMYKEMVAAIRQYRNKNIAGKSKIDISPYHVWQTVMKDSSIKLVEDINPIQNLKETEVVTYGGEGGRGKDSMNKASRAYHINDIGVISEATVDSADVGVISYLSANPQFADLRGRITGVKNPTSTSLLSTSALLAPGAEHDD